MAEFVKSRNWCAIAESTQGASHIASNLPNQDALKILALPEDGLIVAVADGHGGAKYTRSAVGAQFAVEIASDQIRRLLSLPTRRLLHFHRTELQEILSGGIVRHWVEAVTAHVENNPFSEAELIACPECEADPIVPYGATILAAAATISVALFLQLGDGDIVSIARSGDIRRPLERDNRLLGNETLSLCSPDAIQSIRVRLQPMEGDVASRPELILISTDGYANSFADDAAFTKAATDYFAMLGQANGSRIVRENLATWLRETSENGSGDDITVALLHARNATRQKKHVSAAAR